MDFKYELPAHLETKSMGSARLRNRQEQKCLDQKLQEMTSHFRCKSTRMMTEIGDLQDKAKDMLPIGGKMIVCPKGLSEKEKKRYRRLRRRSSTPSMTLTEFDEKLTDFRHEIKTYRRGSNSTHPDDVFLFDANIVDVENHEFCAPLNKHKHAMKEAFRRATTKDVGANPGGQQAHGTHPGTQTRKTVTMMSSGTTSVTRSLSSSDGSVRKHQSKHERHKTAMHIESSGVQLRPRSRFYSDDGSSLGERVTPVSARREIVICPDIIAANRRRKPTATSVTDFYQA